MSRLKANQSKDFYDLVEKVEKKGKWACIYTTGELRDLYDFARRTDTYELKTFETRKEAYEFAKVKLEEISDVYGHNHVTICDPEGDEVLTAYSEYDKELLRVLDVK